MIIRCNISGFKSLRQETELAISPLTILAGANSSGKSALLQTMLLMAQTLSDPDISKPLVLNGKYVQLGQFKDVLSAGDGDGQVRMAFDCASIGSADGADEAYGANLDLAFDASPSGQSIPAGSLHPGGGVAQRDDQAGRRSRG
jgi:hypothetical protein